MARTSAHRSLPWRWRLPARSRNCPTHCRCLSCTMAQGGPHAHMRRTARHCTRRGKHNSCHGRRFPQQWYNVADPAEGGPQAAPHKCHWESILAMRFHPRIPPCTRSLGLANCCCSGWCKGLPCKHPSQWSPSTTPHHRSHHHSCTRGQPNHSCEESDRCKEQADTRQKSQRSHRHKW